MIKPLTPEGLYRLANNTFPDDDDLMEFNALYEIRNGLLLPEGPMPPMEGMELASVAVFAQFSAEEPLWMMVSVRSEGDPPLMPDEDRRLMEGMRDHILTLPEETSEELETLPKITDRFPTTMAALVAWNAGDGTMCYSVHRHPQIPGPRACSLLKEVVAMYECQRAQDDPPPAPTQEDIPN